MRLSGKTFMVTGAASGIGKATAELFCREGATVVAVDINPRLPEQIGELVAGDRTSAGNSGSAVGLVCNLAKEDEVADVVEQIRQRFGRLNGFVHCAAVTRRGNVATLSPEDWRVVLANNLDSAFYLSKHGIPLIEASGNGSIVFISSQLALVGDRNIVAYAASKGALISLARAMAIDHAPSLRVNCICPGAISTPMLWADLPQPEAAQAWKEKHPLKRFGDPIDVANGALYLCSDESGFVTGSTLVIDGGFTSW